MIYLQLFLTFLKIGTFTFGGGYAMLPFVQEEVIKNNWLDLEAVVNFIAVSESSPGPFAVNIATYVGNTVGGFFGAFCATSGIVLPSFIIILIIARFYEKYKNNRVIGSVMTGIKPAVIGLIASAALSIALTVFFPSGFSLNLFYESSFYVSVLIFIICLVMALKKVHPVGIICASALLGILSGHLIK